MKPESLADPELTLIPRLLRGLVDKVCQAPRLVLCLALLGCLASGYLACTRLEYQTQRNDLVSPDREHQGRWRKYLAEFGDDDDIVVVVKGQNKKRMQEALEALAVQVKRQPDHFDRLFYKVDLRNLKNRTLLYLDSKQITKIQDNLGSMSLLLDPPIVGRLDPLIGWKSLTLFSLLHEARLRAGKIAPARPLGENDEQFLTQLESICRQAVTIVDDPETYTSPWQRLLALDPKSDESMLPFSEPQYFFSGDSSLAFLLCRPARDRDSFTSCQQSVAAMRKLIGSVATRFPDLDMGLTGLPVLETDEMVASRDDTQLASLVALAGVALLYLLVFRSWRSPMLTMAALLTGTIWSLGWLTLTVGHLNILSATFAVMLIGMGDYGVLWLARFEEERRNGADTRAALLRTAGGIGPSIVTAAATTALAFYAAMFADFRAVAELGWIAGSGVLLCALSCLTVMPALLTLLEYRVQESAPADAGKPAAAWLPALLYRPGWVVAGGLGFAFVLAVYAMRVHYDHNLLHLQARNLDSVKWELTLIRHTAGASWHALSYTSTREEALELKKEFEKLPIVSRVVEVASLVPGAQKKKLEQLKDIEQRLKKLPPRGQVIPHGMPNVKLLKTELECLAGSLQPIADNCPKPNNRRILSELRHSLLDLRDRLDDSDADTLRRFEERLAGDLAADLHYLRDLAKPQAITTADLPAALRERYIGKSNKWLLRVFGKDSLWEYGPLVHFVDEIRTVDPEATGKPAATLEGLQAMREGFLWAGLYALIAIVVVLAVDFRRPRYILFAMTPLALGLVLSLGIMGFYDLPLNPANMIALPLILGIGIDNGIHVVHDYATRRKQGPYALSRSTGRGMMVASLTTILCFGTLMISHHRGLFGLGFVLALGVTCCMVASLVFLPALLRLVQPKPAKQARVTQFVPAEDRRLAA